MAAITLQQAALWCGGHIEPKYAHIIFEGACNDSRNVQQGQLFVALQGVRDGHDFVPLALEKGASAVLCSRPVGDVPAIVVEDTRLALGQIAAGLRQSLDFKVVGVTGSVGKSTTKEMIACVLEGDYIVSKTPANFNNDLGLPMAILAMPEDTQIAVLEMGMSHFGEISYLSQIAKPDVGVITNIGTMHMENLGSRQGILQAKLEILDGMQPDSPLCLYGDDDMLWGSTLLHPVTYFGTDNKACQVQASGVMQKEGTISFVVTVGENHFGITLPLEGAHYVSDALAAVSVGLKLGVKPEAMARRLAHFRNMEGRQEIFEAKGCTIIKDCYNAGPESMAAALKVLGSRKARRIAVLADMLELGACSQQAHRQVGALAAENADYLLSYGPNAPLMAQGAAGKMPAEHIFIFDNRDAMAQQLRQLCRPADVLLFKGSHGMHMELVLEKFLNEET